MSSKVPIPPPGFDELSIDEQIEYVQALWDRITSNEVSVPDWHMEIVEERMARYRSEGMQGTPFEEFEKELLKD